MTIQVKKIQQESLDDLITIHLNSFKGFFLSELGEGFLKTYYKSISKNERGILLGCFDNDLLIGFCAATTLSAGFNNYLIKKNFLRFLITGINLLIRKPYALIHLFKNFSKKISTVNDSGNYAELLSIGVSPSAQRKGVGKILLNNLENHLRVNNINKLSLTTDYFNNNIVLKFYQSMQFEIYYDFTAYPNRRMYRLIKHI